MKKFIFGVMLLVSMLGIIGCADPSNSGDFTYIVKNGTGSEMTISYKNNSGVYVNKKIVSVDGIYEIPVNDIKIYNIENSGMLNMTYIAGYLKVKVNDTEVEGIVLKVALEKGVKVTGVINTNGDSILYE